MSITSKSQNVRDTFVTVAQLSMDFIPNDTKTNSSNRTSFHSEHQDPVIQYPIHHDLRTILSAFKNILKQHSFKCIDMCEKQILVIRLNIADRLKKLFMCRQPPKFIITVNTHEFLSVREATIKALRSNSSFSFKQSHPNELQEEVKNIYQILIQLRHLSEPGSSNLGELEGQYQQDFYSLDATSYYMFSRMLVDGNYSLGKKMQTVIQKFQTEAELDRISKEELKWLNSALAEISRDLLQGFNCSRKQLLQILAYCRKSVEEYFYNRHHQINANQGILKEKEMDRYTGQAKEIMKIVPATYKCLTKLEAASTSMEIYKLMFMVGLIFKAEVEAETLSEQSIGRSIFLIKKCFSGMINEKSRLLRCASYLQQDYEQFISKFNFDHQVTF